MTDHNFLSVHSLTALPWHNLNRDDRGLPKQVREGGKSRGRLSSQSLKRAARVAYEASVVGTPGKSIRSKTLSEEVLKRAVALAAKDNGRQIDEVVVLALAKNIVGSLTNGDEAKQEKKDKAALAAAVKEAKAEAARIKKGLPPTVAPVVFEADENDAANESDDESEDSAAAGAEKSKDSLTWLSGDELDAIAEILSSAKLDDSVLTDGKLDKKKVVALAITPNKAGSLAIAAFGRMFAAQPGFQSEAAIAVGPAVTTHPITIEVDYFTGVDDSSEGSGAGHLGQAFYTSGVYFRSFTIDKAELRRNWSGWESPDADDRLAELIRSLILTLPSGKENATAAFTRPSLILAEQQQHRSSYQFHEPVRAAEGGGYLAGSINGLMGKAADARAFDPQQFGTTLVSGEGALDTGVLGENAVLADLEATIESIVEWLRA